MSESTSPRAKSRPLRPRMQIVDQLVGRRMRERRLMLGLSQQQLAELIGVTYQQAHKYEAGVNRISAGRLYQIAQALGVDISYFFVGAENSGTVTHELTRQQRLLLDLTRSFIGISSRRHQTAICNVARALANADPAFPDDDQALVIIG